MTDNTIWTFKGDHAFLSNFWPAKVRLDGFVFPSVENAYQAAKFQNGIDRSYFHVCTPRQAKWRGRSAPLPPDWETRKLEVMRELLRQKFENSDVLRSLLLETGEALLVEGNTWGDKFWGADIKTLEGENHLGRLLMELRTEIRGRK